MINESNRMPRRQFVKLAACSAVAAPLLQVGTATAGGHLAKLEEDNPQAMALGYKHDTSAVDAGKYANHDVSQNCAGCNLYQGKDGAAWGECSIFPGKEVAAAGWCSAYVPKA